MKAKNTAWNRYTKITRSMLGPTYSVYNGKVFVPVTPTQADIGKKFIDLVNIYQKDTPPCEITSSTYPKKTLKRSARR